MIRQCNLFTPLLRQETCATRAKERSFSLTRPTFQITRSLVARLSFHFRTQWSSFIYLNTFRRPSLLRVTRYDTHCKQIKSVTKKKRNFDSFQFLFIPTSKIGFRSAFFLRIFFSCLSLCRLQESRKTQEVTWTQGPQVFVDCYNYPKGTKLVSSWRIWRCRFYISGPVNSSLGLQQPFTVVTNPPWFYHARERKFTFVLLLFHEK